MNRRLACAVVVAVVATLLLARECCAWGATGHRIIGLIAWARLTPEAKAAIQEMLGEQSLGDAGCWADEMRGKPEYEFARALHFVNTARDAEAIDTARDCPNGDCVVGAIRKFRATAIDGSAPREQRIEALKFLIHFVGDVHQPLHVSYADDRGGNRMSLQFMGKRTNLHALWDTGLIEQRLAGADWMRYGTELSASITDETAAAYAGSVDPLAWANESLGITRRLYADLNSDDLGDAYYTANIGSVEVQLQRAGVRLAAMLNAMFAPAPAPQPTSQPSAGGVVP